MGKARRKYKRYKIKGFTHDMYLDLYEKQDAVCAVCYLPETVKTKDGRIRDLAVDHDHATGEVRGLLCFRCNTKLHILENYRDAAQSYLDVSSS